MDGLNPEVSRIYGNRVRIRVCGICVAEQGILLINHAMGQHRNFWAPPGGGVEFGQSLQEALKREFIEETGLSIEVGKFMFGCEFIDSTFHAIETFFEVRPVSGMLRTGSDPELNIIKDVRHFKLADLKSLGDNELHGILRRIQSLQDLHNLAGFYRI